MQRYVYYSSVKYIVYEILLNERIYFLILFVVSNISFTFASSETK
nr:MAG TPA: hypothetical protein [Caudoviricetes sp.]